MTEVHTHIYIYIYIQTLAQNRPAIIRISCLTMLGNILRSVVTCTSTLRSVVYVNFNTSICCLREFQRGMSGTATTCPGTSLGIPKYSGHVPGLQYPRMSHARGACGSWNTQYTGIPGGPWILEYFVSRDSWDHPGMSHARGLQASLSAINEALSVKRGIS